MPFKEESEEEKDSPRDYLLITCLVIAALELIQSLTFAFHSIYDLSLHVSKKGKILKKKVIVNII